MAVFGRVRPTCTAIKPSNGWGALELTARYSMLDLDSGKSLAVASDYNRQVRSGADVISRIDQASRPGGLERLRDQAVTTINVLLRRLCRQTSVAQESQ